MNARVAALEAQLAQQRRAQDESLATRGRETSQALQARDEQRAQLQRRLDEQTAQIGECTAKNDRLVGLSAQLIERYRRKSVADVLKQQDPLLGLGDVRMFNDLQEVRDKAEAERFVPGDRRP